MPRRDPESPGVSTSENWVHWLHGCDSQLGEGVVFDLHWPSVISGLRADFLGDLKLVHDDEIAHSEHPAQEAPSLLLGFVGTLRVAGDFQPVQIT
jgi:hypothetical protein